jgi:hypothetical protein
MDWKNEYRNNKGKIFAIGAGALVLALIAFSGICWCALGLCGNWIPNVQMSFWEVLSFSGISFVALLLVRPLGKRWLAATSSGDILPLDHRQLDALGATPPPKASWEELYDQLSIDERQTFKEMMGKFVEDSDDAGKPEDER